MREVHSEMLQEFYGCDGDDAGSPEKPSIWLFGIEWGRPKDKNEDDGSYSIEIQRNWPYNRNAFKLFAVAHGFPLEEWHSFAELHQPFVAGQKTGFFKGNIYPLAFHNIGEWTKEAEETTGFGNKQEYLEWCRKHRLPAVKKWVDKHRPTLFIGVGRSSTEDFSNAVFGSSVALESKSWQSKTGQTKWLSYAKADGLKLIVIPHLSGGKNGLNSNASIEWAGQFIREILKEQ